MTPEQVAKAREMLRNREPFGRIYAATGISSEQLFAILYGLRDMSDAGAAEYWQRNLASLTTHESLHQHFKARAYPTVEASQCEQMAALVVRLRNELEHTNQHLVAHIDALTKSNAQCAEYLRRNEQLHSELVDVRSALAATTDQRDSLQRTLDEGERADTTPHERIEPPTVPDDLEFREGIPTPAMIAICSWWEVQGRGDVICFKNKDQRPVVWRSLRGDASWQYEDCPQPLKPSKRTWKQIDLLLATAPHDVADHVVPPVCFDCGSRLVEVGGLVFLCRSADCMKRLPTGAP